MTLSNAIREKIIKGSLDNILKNSIEEIEILKTEIYNLLTDFYIKNSCKIEENSKSKTDSVIIRMSKNNYQRLEITRQKEIEISCNFKYLDSSFSRNFNGLYFYYEDLEKNYRNKIDILNKKIEYLEKIRSKLKSEMKNLVYGCRTDKQLKELFPDIENISGVKLNNEHKNLVKLDLTELNNLIYQAKKGG